MSRPETRGLHRFFVEQAAVASVSAGDPVSLGGAQAHQVSRVLRLRPGSRLVLLDGNGAEYLVRLDEVRSSSVTGTVEAVLASRPEPQLRLTLYQALVPRDRFETVLQKGTEVGIVRFVPTWCERSIVPGGDAVDAKRLERWRRIVTEAAEQCERGIVPEVCAPLRFSETVRQATAAGPTLVAWEREDARSLRYGLIAAGGRLPSSDAMPPPSPNPSPSRTLGPPLRGANIGFADIPSGLPRSRGRGEYIESVSPTELRSRIGGPGNFTLALFVGPEGGFSDAEIAEATDLGALTVSLGPRILRTETAGPILAALALYEAGDLDPIPTEPAP
ncbi:MAG: 16S rRNA (uracil(1498)-N(3))-methyltransferase [Chloroflexota bacterium]